MGFFNTVDHGVVPFYPGDLEDVSKVVHAQPCSKARVGSREAAVWCLSCRMKIRTVGNSMQGSHHLSFWKERGKAEPPFTIIIVDRV